jgi:glucan phosphoethanolaminetransferase (alkaline phosphatase superfamily)
LVSIFFFAKRISEYISVVRKTLFKKLKQMIPAKKLRFQDGWTTDKQTAKEYEERKSWKAASFRKRHSGYRSPSRTCSTESY